jgi:hypothetical protein
VSIDRAIEHGSRILADARVDHSTTARVLLDKVGDIMDNTGDADESTAILGLVDVVVPLNDGKLVERHTPIKSAALLVKLLLQLLNTSLLDLVVAELLEVEGETHLLPDPDVPLGRIILVPLNGVTVVGRKLVVEVVVSLTKSDESGDDVVARRVTIVEGLVAEPVSKRVDAEGGLLNEEDAENTSVDESTNPVTPAETCNERGKEQTHDENNSEVVLVLEANDWVFVEIRDVSTTDTLRVLLHNHPAEMRVEETLAHGVRILVSVGVAVVGTVVSGPPSDGTFDGTATNSGQVDT